MSLDHLPRDLRISVAKWLEYDKNTQTREEVLGLIESKNWDELHKRFDERICFGTSGLRAKMEAGFNRMNNLTVIQASQGLATYIKSVFPKNLRVVIGHDHRFHSKSFAEVTVAAFLQAGFEVYYLNCAESSPSYAHTPLVPFAIENILSDTTAACGVMITASHNPKMDNGYKVYFNNGCQIIPPHDKNIAKCIEESLVPWEHAWDTEILIEEAELSNRLHDIKEDITQKYLKRISTTLLTNSPDFSHSKPWFVYTPMHGVGNEIFEKVAALLDLKENRDYLVPLEQKDPNPEFPTVPFPNPEEQGALDLALALADDNDISLVIANDPDADRFSAAVKDSNGWTQLTGNQIGFLFALHHLEEHHRTSGKIEDLGMLASTVSSQMLSTMASLEGFAFEETLTGFKWLGNCARDMEQRGYVVPYAFEESIGYMFTGVVHDKDGVAAAIVFLQMYNKWKKEKLSVLQVLQNAYEKYGNFAEFNGYYRVPDPASTAKVFEYIRNDYFDPSQKYPSTIGGEFRVTSFRDLTTGFQSDTPDNIPNLPVDASSHMITCVLQPSDSKTVSADLVRFTIRGSGTEPKLKVYIEGRAQNADRAKYLAKLAWDVLRREWFRPEQSGLTTSF